MTGEPSGSPVLLLHRLQGPEQDLVQGLRGRLVSRNPFFRFLVIRLSAAGFSGAFCHSVSQVNYCL